MLQSLSGRGFGGSQEERYAHLGTLFTDTSHSIPPFPTLHYTAFFATLK